MCRVRSGGKGLSTGTSSLIVLSASMEQKMTKITSIGSDYRFVVDAESGSEIEYIVVDGECR